MLAEYRVRIFSFSVEYDEPRFTFEPAPPMYSINSVHRFYFSGTIFLNYLERVGVDHSAPSGTPEGLCRQVNPGQALSGDIGVCFESL